MITGSVAIYTDGTYQEMKYVSNQLYLAGGGSFSGAFGGFIPDLYYSANSDRNYFTVTYSSNGNTLPSDATPIGWTVDVTFRTVFAQSPCPYGDIVFTDSVTNAILFSIPAADLAAWTTGNLPNSKTYSASGPPLNALDLRISPVGSSPGSPLGCSGDIIGQITIGAWSQTYLQPDPVIPTIPPPPWSSWGENQAPVVGRGAQAGDVLVSARTHLNDDEGIIWPDQKLFPKLREAHRMLQVALVANGVPI